MKFRATFITDKVKLYRSKMMHYRVCKRILMGPICEGYGTSVADVRRVKCPDCLKLIEQMRKLSNGVY